MTTSRMETAQMSMEDVKILATIRYYVDGILLLFVIILGLLGNSLTIAALSRTPKIHPPMRVLLSCLAISDIVVLLCSMLLICIPQLVPCYTILVYPYIIVYVYPLAMVAQTCSTWFIVAITVLRAIAICCPLRAPVLLSKRHVRSTIAAIVVLSFLANFSRWFEYEIVFVAHDGEIRRDVKITALGTNQTYNAVYYLYFYTVVMMSMPLLLLTVSNTLLIKSAKESRKCRKLMSRQRRIALDVNLTIMTVCVISVFILCHVPAYVYDVAYYLNSNIRNCFLWEILSSIRLFMVTFSSAANFALYCVSGRTFRIYFINMFNCQKNKIVTKLNRRKESELDSSQLDCAGKNSFIMMESRISNDYVVL